MAAEVPNRIQQIIQEDGDITSSQVFEILETATPTELNDAYNILMPGGDQIPNIPQEE